MTIKAIKIRIYPNVEQRQSLAKHFGCSRFVYNWALGTGNDFYKKNKKGLGRGEISVALTAMKSEPEYLWLKDVNAQSLQQALTDCNRALVNFFKKRAKFPRFKSKYAKQSFRIPQSCRVDEKLGKIYLQKIGHVKCKLHRTINGTIKSVTVSRAASGKYFASINTEVEDSPEPITKIDKRKVVSLDLGLIDFVFDSNGHSVKAKKEYRKLEKKLRREQKSLSRKQLGSQNRNKQRIRVALVHEKIANKRKDFLHKLSRKYIDENQAIVVEDLAVKNMVKNRRLSKSISDAGWSMFTTMLEYKALWNGKHFVKIDRWFPSSKTCHECGTVNQNMKLSTREWACDCGAHHQRDLNAALNIKREGIKLLTAAGNVVIAYGEDVREACAPALKNPVFCETGSPCP